MSVEVADSDNPKTETTLEQDELRALRLLAEGRTESQAARELAISEATLRRLLRRARQGLEANSTIHAVYLAAKRGLI